MTQTNYTRDLADTICGRMTEGESLRAICRDPGMPSEGAVRGWAVRDVDGFGERYRAARSLLLEAWADQIVDIADEADLDPRDRQIRVHTRQWLMSKLAPRRYGDRLLHSGDPENPLRVMHQQVSLENLTDDQLEALDKFTQSLVEAKG
jgi:Bacteriophage Sf6, terminase small subunit-like